MLIVAGPPGSGKSTFFNKKFLRGLEYFNADDRAAELAGGYGAITRPIREQVNEEFRNWINSEIQQGKSFAFETTLRTDITFQQAQTARDIGFRTQMRYVAASVEQCLERVKIRADAGGHAASESTLRGIYDASMKNLARAFGDPSIEFLRVYDNSKFGEKPRLVAEMKRGKPVYVADDMPKWLESAIAG